MTTPAAAEAYLAHHLISLSGKGYAIHNPNDRPVHDLPVIYGFNNGGNSWMLHAVLIAEDGEPMGGHGCSHEGYMPADLGILEGTRPDRHELFRQKYPDGYRMEFVGYADAEAHEGLKAAFAAHDARSAAQSAAA